MGIYIGTTEPKSIYVGTTAVKEVYVGTTKVRPSGYTPTNLIAHWKFNGNYNDETGNFNATASSGGTWTTLPGSSNQYLRVNYSGQEARAAQISADLFGALLNTNKNLTFNRWWYYSAQPNSGSYSRIDGVYTQGSGSWRVIRAGYGYEGNGLSLGLGNSSGYYNYDGYNYRPSTGTWHNFIYTYQASNRQKCYYVDGSLRGTVTQASVPNTGTGQDKGYLFMTNSGTTFNGGVSELIIENKVMTAAEVSLYYNSTKANYGL